MNCSNFDKLALSCNKQRLFAILHRQWMRKIWLNTSIFFSLSLFVYVTLFHLSAWQSYQWELFDIYWKTFWSRIFFSVFLLTNRIPEHKFSSFFVQHPWIKYASYETSTWEKINSEGAFNWSNWNSLWKTNLLLLLFFFHPLYEFILVPYQMMT